MAAELFSPPSRALSANADPYAGARWFFYQTGTLTPQFVYADALLTTSLPNPVVADSGGKFPPIYFDASLSYRGICRDATGSVTLHDIDPINSGVISALKGSAGAASVGFLQLGTGSQLVTLEANERSRPVSPRQWGCIGDGVTDDASNFAALVAYASSSGRTIELEQGKTYFLASWTPVTTAGFLRIVGNGATIRGPATVVGFCFPTTNFQVENCVFDRWLTVFNRRTAETGLFNSVKLTHNVFTNIVSIAVNIEKNCTNYLISDNEWRNCSGAFALRIGDNLIGNQNTWSRGIIKNNRFLSLTSVGSASSAAMLIYGYSTLIDGNHIDGVLSSSGEAWGIYVKSRYSVIVNNIIRNVNTTTGSEVVGINLKGDVRTSLAAPHGFSVICANNQIFNIGVMGVKGAGIRCQSDDLLVQGNILEDTGIRGIVSDDSNIYRDHLVTGNKISANSPTGFFALGIEGSGSRIRYTNNIVYNAVVGVNIAPYVSSGLNEIDVHGNIIDSTVIGVQLSPSFNITGLRIQNNTVLRASNAILNNEGTGTLSRVVVTDNEISGSVTKWNGSIPSGTILRNNIGWMEASQSYDPPSIATSAGVTTTITCAGALLGDIVYCSFSNPLQGLVLTGWVSAENTVSVRFTNLTGSAIDLASGTLAVKVERMR